ncbi:hypothetical protein BDV28DRAFT_141648 [Aspergillus coremiiformis]|uniref:Uncharacterized protein n=1 Tax=Aspergillus coremiiformis TaxID=138285 RepID=A0A5N6YVT1_9EURO|nr:hypothetical protein BDV28DRAFT_141648 [Aspergillus coremiiformis]
MIDQVEGRTLSPCMLSSSFPTSNGQQRKEEEKQEDLLLHFQSAAGTLYYFFLDNILIFISMICTLGHGCISCSMYLVSLQMV